MQSIKNIDVCFFLLSFFSFFGIYFEKFYKDARAVGFLLGIIFFVAGFILSIVISFKMPSSKKYI